MRFGGDWTSLHHYLRIWRLMPRDTLPKTNSSPLKMDGWKMIHFLLGPAFSGAFAVSFGKGTTWRIIPFSKWLITMVSRLVPLPNGLFMAYKWGLYTNHLRPSWEPILQVGSHDFMILLELKRAPESSSPTVGKWPKVALDPWSYKVGPY